MTKPDKEKEYEEKTILVLERVGDCEMVLGRYKKKGWEPVSYERVPEPLPESVRIRMRRKKTSESKHPKP